LVHDPEKNSGVPGGDQGLTRIISPGKGATEVTATVVEKPKPEAPRSRGWAGAKVGRCRLNPSFRVESGCVPSLGGNEKKLVRKPMLTAI